MSESNSQLEISFGKARAFGSVDSAGTVVDKVAVPFSMINRAQAVLASFRLEIALLHEGELIAVIRTAPWDCPKNLLPG